MITVTISKQKYDTLRREAAAWRRAVSPASGIIFDAVRDNGGKGVSVKHFIQALEKLERKSSAA